MIQLYEMAKMKKLDIPKFEFTTAYSDLGHKF